MKAGLSNFAVSCIAIDNSGPKAVIYLGTEKSGIFKSANYGTSWSPINNGLDNLYTVNILCNTTKTTNLFLSTRMGNIFVSENSGSLWRSIELSNIETYLTYLVQTSETITNRFIIYALNTKGEIFKILDYDRIEKIGNKTISDICCCIGVSNLNPIYILIGTSSGLYKLNI